jgi:NAD(P)-dependent dehydrogenase (short-subunit alcohol dehydrogenase family)
MDIKIFDLGFDVSLAKTHETSTEYFQQIIQTNLLGILFPTRFAIPHIKESHGSILFISSLAGLFGLPYISVYSPSKMALTAAAQMLRLEMDPARVHIEIAYVGFLINDPEKKVLGLDGQWLPPATGPDNFISPSRRPAPSSSKL